MTRKVREPTRAFPRARPAVSGPRPVLRVGLTGGIASGKSTVAGFLAELGAHVVDADAIVHDLLAPGGGAHAPVVEAFGRAILDDDGSIDRRRLGRVVFEDASRRRALEEIVHPRVRLELERRIDAVRRSPGGPVVVVDAALLVETGSHRGLDRVLVVRCERETQIRRLIDRDGMTRDEAEGRLRAQAPLEAKLAVADHVIDTGTSLAETRRRTAEVYAALVRDFESRFGAAGGRS